MLRFLVFDHGQPARNAFLEGAYLVGSDGVPLRADITFANGEIRCTKRAPGPAGLAVFWPVKGFGRLVLETTRLVERDEPYNLHVELARGRLMRISHKREDWGLYDYPDGAEHYRRVDDAKAHFIAALTAPDEAAAAQHADLATELAVTVGEDLGLFHADLFVKRRRSTGMIPKRPFGVGVSLAANAEQQRQPLRDAFDFVTLPVSWRDIEPKPGSLKWDPLDLWVNWLAQHRLHVRAGPLVSLAAEHLPDWLTDRDDNYEQMRESLVNHALSLVRRFTHRIQSWEVVSGLHAVNSFHFNLEQLMDLTRTSTMVIKQNAPRSNSIITIVLPWGEYYARDPRTIPPLLYADLCVQSGFHFDAFGLQFQFGAPYDGMLVRDLMQVSALIDRFANFGKPLHITAVQVPSETVPAQKKDSPLTGGGVWHEPWSEPLQARWLRQFYELAFSKPFVETIAWRQLTDGSDPILRTGGLIRPDGSRKPAFDQLLEFRQAILGDRTTTRQRKTHA
jgi:endo-1,4-beta-xylanase